MPTQKGERSLALINFLCDEMVEDEYQGEIRINFGEGGTVRAITHDQKMSNTSEGSVFNRRVYTGGIINKAGKFIQENFEKG
jgi:hypothetical protein